VTSRKRAEHLTSGLVESFAIAQSWYLRRVSEEHEEKSWATGAWVDMTTIVVMVDAARLSEQLSNAFPLSLRRVAGIEPHKHPVCVELWRIRDGRIEAFGRDQHEWSQLAATAFGSTLGIPTGVAVGSTLGAATSASAASLGFAALGPLGGIWGAGVGFMAGAALGAIRGATAFAALGQNVFRDTARGASESASRKWGTYHEAAVVVPSVVRRDGSGGPHQFVCGMHTDNPFAKWTAETVGYGFRKKLAVARCEPFSQWSWSTASAGTLLEARFSRPRPEDAFAARDAVQSFVEWVQAPFLGPNVAGELVETELAREIDYDNALVSRARGELFLAEGFSDVLDSGRYPIEANGGVTAIHAENVFLRLTLPKPFPA